MLDPCYRPETRDAPWCCPDEPVKNLTGPDEPALLCWVPEGCCMPSVCDIKEWDFLCALRSLLPEGDIYNNTRQAVADPPVNVGAVNIGCADIGCEQLILGGCCDDTIQCTEEPIAPQLAVVDSYGAVVYKVIETLCAMLRELDPCTADKLIKHWAERMGIKHWDPCGPGFSDRMLAMLICIIVQLRNYQGAINWEFIQALAHRFGADISLMYAGDLNCKPEGGWGWWTMARDSNECPPVQPCPPDAPVGAFVADMHLRSDCEGVWQSLNVVVCPADILIPANCNLAIAEDQILPHDPELYEVFRLWLLPKLLEGQRGVYWCIYDGCKQPDNDCIVLNPWDVRPSIFTLEGNKRDAPALAER